MKSLFRRNDYTRRTRKTLNTLDPSRSALEQDPARRLRNAEIALYTLDPHYETWIKKNVRKSWPILERVRIIEKQARTLLMDRYKSILGESRINQIINSNLPFNDQGHLWAR